MKVEKLNKKELDEYCLLLGIDIKKKKKADLYWKFILHFLGAHYA